MKNLQELEMIQCVRCSGPMPKLRFEKYGYRHCLKCSTVERVGGVPITNHKTGNTIQIVPKEIADNLIRLNERKGYGVMSGMKHN